MSSIGKFVKIKDSVKIDFSNQLTQIHNYPYRICNEKNDGKWICLETKVHSALCSVGGNKYEIIDRSFWMKTEECEVVENPKDFSYYNKNKSFNYKIAFWSIIGMIIITIILIIK